MEKTAHTATKAIQTASSSTSMIAKEFGHTLVEVLDRFEGKQSSVKLSFEDLTLDAGYLKSSVTGAVVLTLNHPHE